MDQKIERLFVVIGAGSGIGSEIARRISTISGNYVLACGRREEPLSSHANSPQVTARVCDVTQEQQVRELFASLSQPTARLAGIINCAGSVILKPAHLASLEEFQSALSVNLVSCFLLVKYGVPLMTEVGGSFVFFSTAAIQARLANHDVIDAAKAGVEGLTRGWRLRSDVRRKKYPL